MRAVPSGAESPVSDDPYLVVARIVRPRGNHGEVLAEIETDFPQERFRPGEALLRDRSGRLRKAVVEETWFHKDRVVIKFEGVDTIGQAETLRGLEWIVPEEEAHPLPEGTHYRHALAGLEVRTRSGEVIGWIREVEPGAEVDLLVLEAGGREVLVPAARPYVREVHEEEGYAVLDVPPELMDLND